jgi:hypothetical protein
MTDGPTNPMPGAPVSLVERVKNILTTPKTEWPRIAAEPATVGGLFTGYAMIVAALPAIASLIGQVLVGLPIGFAIAQVVVAYLVGLAVVFAMSFVGNELAGAFGGTKNQVQATKIAVYAATPGWIVGILAVVPQLALLIVLLGFLAILYGAFLIYLGATPVMKIPEDKAIVYAIVMLVSWIVIYWILLLFLAGIILSAFGFGMMAAVGGMPRY